MNNGTGTMTMKMFMSEKGYIIPTRNQKGGGAIGLHRQDSGDDINFVISGTSKAIFKENEEILKRGCRHVYPHCLC